MTGGKITGIGLDPGIKNFGVSVVQMDAKNPLSRYAVTYCGMIPQDCLVNTWSWNELAEQVRRFATYLHYIVDTANPHATQRSVYVVAERFQTRGLLASSAGEHVGIMLGAAMKVFAEKDVEVFMVTPGQWKPKFRKHLPAIYNEARADVRKMCRKFGKLPTLFVKNAQGNAVHCVDATGMVLSHQMDKGGAMPANMPLKVSRRLLRGMLQDG